MCEETVYDETLDLLSIYRRFKNEYPDFTVFQHGTDPKKEGYYVRLVISPEDTPDHNYARLNVADDTTLTVGPGSYVTWKYATEEHVKQAIRYAYTWLNRYLPANKFLESSKNLTKIDYSKIKLASVCRTALINARTVALHLEHNREYLLAHFNEIELEQGIAFLKKIEAIC